MIKINKNIILALIIIFSSFPTLSYAGSLTFPSATYEGEVKKGKAHGVGVFTFSDGSIYKGKVSKNRIHGKGKYIDAQGKVYEGKFRYGTIKTKLNKETRSVVKIKPKTGFITMIEMKGTGSLTKTQYFEATEISSGKFELTKKGSQDMAAAEKSGEAGGEAGASGGSGGGGC